MSVIPVQYDVPADIARGLASGELMRFGSVVRNSTRIVAHLKETQLRPEAAAESPKKVLAAITKPATLWTIATTTVIVGSCTFAYSQHQRVEELVDGLAGYFDAVRYGSLDQTHIDRLSTAAANLPRIFVRAETLAPLIKQVGHITAELARANSVRLTSTEARAARGDNITDLRNNLETQRRIFKNAA